MIKKFVFTVFLTGSFILVGCGGPSTEQIAKIDFGTKPQNINKEDLKDAFIDILKDPDSLQIKIVNTALRKAYLPYYKHKTGWIVTIKANAKNSYGGYVGYEDYYILVNSAGKGLEAIKVSESRYLVKFINK